MVTIGKYKVQFNNPMFSFQTTGPVVVKPYRITKVLWWYILRGVE